MKKKARRRAEQRKTVDIPMYRAKGVLLLFAIFTLLSVHTYDV